MPIVSSFYGIKIYIYWFEERHHTPHFHAYYSEFQATFALDGEFIKGRMPKTAKKLIKRWALENHTEICYAWEEAIKDLPIRTIRGLL